MSEPAPAPIALVVYFYFDLVNPITHQTDSLPVGALLPGWLAPFWAYWAAHEHVEAGPVVTELGTKAGLRHRWETSDAQVQLVQGQVRTITDTMVVGLRWRLTGAAETAWPDAYKKLTSRLSAFIKEELPQLPFELAQRFIRGLRGYSLLYITSVELVPNTLPKNLLYAAATSLPEPLIVVGSAYDKGGLWLVAPPHTTLARQYNVEKLATQPATSAGLGCQVATSPLAAISQNAFAVYVALAPLAEYETFLVQEHGFPHHHAPFLAPDLFAHKAYGQRHNLGQTNEHGTKLHQHAENLQSIFTTSSELMRQRVGKEADLQEDEQAEQKLSEAYGHLMHDFSLITRTRLSLEYQLINLRQYLKGAASSHGRAAWDYHLACVELAEKDLTLWLNKDNLAIQSAQTTIAIVRQRLERARNDTQHTRGLVLGGLGIIIALISLFKGEAVLDMYHRWWPWPLSKTALNFIGPAKSIHIFFAELAVVGIGLFLMGLWYLYYKLARKRKHGQATVN